VFGPDCVKTRGHKKYRNRSHRRLQLFDFGKLNEPGRTYCKGSTTPFWHHACIAVISASEPSNLITRFMLYASTCKLISVLTRAMVRVRK
jgi:hypothetical protein